MIQWVFEAVQAADIASRIVVATPDEEIIQACRRFGCEAILTKDTHPSGTDRTAEVAEAVKADVYVNVQGDEPLISAQTIRATAEPLLKNDSIAMGSAYSICPEPEIPNPAVVKVVLDRQSNALYFSRYPIPCDRNARILPVYKHIGIYAFRREVLFDFAGWEPTPLEMTESLEQLRFLEHGIKIRMSEGEASALAVDTPEQAEEVRAILERRS